LWVEPKDEQELLSKLLDESNMSTMETINETVALLKSNTSADNSKPVTRSSLVTSHGQRRSSVKTSQHEKRASLTSSKQEKRTSVAESASKT
jgi:hypothetical protein